MTSETAGMHKGRSIVDFLRPHWMALTLALLAVVGEAGADVAQPDRQYRYRLRLWRSSDGPALPGVGDGKDCGQANLLSVAAAFSVEPKTVIESLPQYLVKA